MRTVTVSVSLDDLRGHGVRSAADVLEVQRSPDAKEYLIEGLMGLRQIVILAGDSGHGKSPFAYQASLCVAEPKPFMGFQVRQAAVLYLDFEDSLADSEIFIRPMIAELGLNEPPPLWRVWHSLEAPAKVELCPLVESWLECAEHAGLPKLLVIDPYEEWPGASTKNDEIRGVFGRFRDWQKEYQLTVWLNHHVNKEPTHESDRFLMPSLSDEPRRWLERSRGGKNLINASDVRLGFEEAQPDRITLAGFRRAKGKIGPLCIVRQLDEDGDALCYRRSTVAEQLGKEEAAIYEKLDAEFKTGDVKRLGIAHSMTCNRLLKEWGEKSIVRRVSRGVYQKVGTEGNL